MEVNGREGLGRHAATRARIDGALGKKKKLKLLFTTELQNLYTRHCKRTTQQ